MTEPINTHVAEEYGITDPLVIAKTYTDALASILSDIVLDRPRLDSEQLSRYLATAHIGAQDTLRKIQEALAAV